MDLIELGKKIVPEVFDIIELRYNILRTIYYNQPIGRRGLSYQLNIGERTIRREVNILKEYGLLNIESMGMYVTEEGKNVIKEMEKIMHRIKGISNLEEALTNLLKVDKILIVPGNSDDNNLTLKDMGKVASMTLRKLIKEGSIIGVTGGTTMAHVAEEMPLGKVANDVLVIPARGGLGKEVETQSNSIAAKLAKKLDANYKLLHVPDNVDKVTLNAILNVPDVKEIIELIRDMDILIFGIGRADVMAKRRQLSKEKIDDIINKGAVAEAFGHYFNIEGKEVWESLTVGISLDTFQKIDNVIGVAGGEEKAEAIMAIASLRKNMTIITDEGAAKKIIKIAKKATR
ncbi:central glycolytic genes regulator [Keratinibaculum paraultunense]|uniref:Central glycolytic genes regulator n=1 Tax=Keratinibaculum paraultunense TaxID=1278232 RepID=A0A4R3KXV9_9FIRM|nr:sugar-binding domain-containing protein [Keratinibaculum paraultunense]QQY80274.1 sugar-binding transcriptional regulator [Keratinibaculum paraultunense]TCS90790.1 central glycolytic genes regulator [Keratinibaculum paraultunense]